MDSFAQVVSLPNFHSLSIKLDRSNYAFWKAQILSTVRAYGFDELIDKFHTPPVQFLPTPTGDRHPNPDFLHWIRRDQYLVSWILSSISESMLGHVTRCVTARDIWSVLEELFQSQSKARIMQLKLQLQTQKKGDMSVDDYFLKMRNIADLLAAAGKPITDDDLALQILQGFGMDYDAVVVNFTNRPESLNLQEVHFALQAHEIRLQNQNSIAFPSAHVAYNRGGFSGQQFIRGGNSGFRGRGGRFQSNMSRMICQLCAKPGHVALKCFKRFDVHYTGSAPPISHPQAYFTDSSSYDMVQADPINTDYDASWYVDSGATNHMTNDLSNLQLSTPYQGLEQVAVGNGQQLPITAVGNASISTSTKPILLRNILCVPQLTKNLVSISKFTKDNGVFVEFHDTVCFVKEKTTCKTLMKGDLINGLYQLDLSKLQVNKQGSTVQVSPASKPSLYPSKLPCTSSTFLAIADQFPTSTISENDKSVVDSSCTVSIPRNNISAFPTSCTVDINAWHQKLGHPSPPILTKTLRCLSSKFDSSLLAFCDACHQGKMHQISHVSLPTKTTKPFQVIHSDLWGPAFTSSAYGYRYYIHFIDDFTRYTWIYPITLKSEATKIVKIFLQMIQTQFGVTVHTLQTDWGGEFRPLVHHLESLGVHFQHPCPYIHQQNGKAERKHQHIVNVGLTLLAQAQMPLKFWWDAFSAAVYLINRLVSPTTAHNSPYYLLYNSMPDYKFLKVFGCSCFPFLKPYNRHKLEFRSSKCLFLGYSLHHKGYKCLHPSGRMYISDSVIFNELEFPYHSLFSLTSSSTPPAVVTMFKGPVYSLPSSDHSLSSTHSNSSSSYNSSPSPPPATSPSSTSHPTPSSNPPHVNTHAMQTRAKSGIYKPKAHLTQFTSATSQPSTSSLSQKPSLPIAPRSHKLALSDPAWYKTMEVEDMALKQKATWKLIPPSADQKLISNKWVFRVKTKADGSLDKLKARLVARGFEQLAGVDYLETFSPVVKFSTIRLIFTLAATRQWSIQQIDINNAFLNGDLEETIYMTQPKGFEDPQFPSYVCKLNKSLYGLKQAPRAWYEKLRNHLYSLGFHRSTSDFSLFYKAADGKLLLILIYVDDILVTGDSSASVLEVIAQLNKEFALKTLGEVHYFLGIEVVKTAGQYHLLQSQYILDLLDRNNLLDCNPSSTPMSCASKLAKSDGVLLDNPTIYRSAIGALQYLTLTRPDIAFTVNKLSQFLKAPTDLHWGACKHLMRYLKGTTKLSLCFSPTSSFSFAGFVDADWASCVDDRRSTGGHCVFLGDNLLVWSSKKQAVVSRSSAESEYRALANAASDLIWLQSICKELSIPVAGPSNLWCDNQSAIALASNPVFHARTKHIEVDVHFVREKVQAKIIDVGYVPSEDQIADIFTKPLAEKRFLLLRSRLKLKELHT